jgi:hypothetical protein
MSFRVPDLEERQSSAAAAKKAMLEKFRAASADPAAAERHAARAAIHEARLARMAEREAAKRRARPNWLRKLPVPLSLLCSSNAKRRSLKP